MGDRQGPRKRSVSDSGPGQAAALAAVAAVSSKAERMDPLELFLHQHKRRACEWGYKELGLRCRKVARGVCLVRTGDVMSEAFIVQRGELLVRKDALGSSVEVMRLGEGSLVGDLLVLMGRPAKFDVLVGEDGAEVAILAGTTLRQELDAGHPELGRLMQHVATLFDSPFFHFVCYFRDRTQPTHLPTQMRLETRFQTPQQDPQETKGSAGPKGGVVGLVSRRLSYGDMGEKQSAPERKPQRRNSTLGEGFVDSPGKILEVAMDTLTSPCAKEVLTRFSERWLIASISLAEDAESPDLATLEHSQSMQLTIDFLEKFYPDEPSLPKSNTPGRTRRGTLSALLELYRQQSDVMIKLNRCPLPPVDGGDLVLRERVSPRYTDIETPSSLRLRVSSGGASGRRQSTPTVFCAEKGPEKAFPLSKQPPASRVVSAPPSRRQGISVPGLLSCDDVNAWNLDCRAVKDPKEMQQIMFQLVDGLSLVAAHKLDRERLLHFISLLESQYNPSVMYHNINHALEVAHSLYWFVHEGHLDSVLTPCDILSLLLAAMGHDAGHPGHNNEFEAITHSSLIQTYGEESVLEHFHCDKTHEALETSGLLTHLNPVTVEEIRESVRTCILATDSTKHFPILLEAEGMGDIFNLPVARKSIGERRTLMKLLIKAADLCNAAKHPLIALKCASLVMEETFRQGDKEREMGLTIPFSRDRYAVDVLQSQVDFICTFVRPLYLCVVRSFPSLALTFQILGFNQKLYMNEKSIREAEKKSHSDPARPDAPVRLHPAAVRSRYAP